jgi:hypothetical protein
MLDENFFKQDIHFYAQDKYVDNYTYLPHAFEVNHILVRCGQHLTEGV